MKLQFSLRSFLIAVAVLGIVLFPIANFLYQVKSQVWRQQAAVAKLQDTGSIAERAVLVRPAKEGVRYRDEEASWWVHFARDYVDPLAYEPRPQVALGNGQEMLDVATCEQQLSLVRDLYKVEGLGLEVERVTVSMINQVAALPDLHSLTLRCETIDPDVLPRLAELTRINELVLETPLNDAIASAVEKMPGLTDLLINPTGLNAESATKLGNCKQLKVLWVQRGDLAGGELFQSWGKRGTAKQLHLVECKLDSKATQAISRLTTLERFVFSQTSSATSELPVALSGLTNLRDLSIWLPENVSITDLCKNSARLTKLQRLEFCGAAMNSEALSALRPLSELKYLLIVGEFSRDEIVQFLKSGPTTCKVRTFWKSSRGLGMDQSFELP